MTGWSPHRWIRNVIRVIERHCEEKHLAYKHMEQGCRTRLDGIGKHFPTAMIFFSRVSQASPIMRQKPPLYRDIQIGFELLCDVLKELSAQTFPSW